jgi:glycosyltransferase involved in cell wall biosynthesis
MMLASQSPAMMSTVQPHVGPRKVCYIAATTEGAVWIFEQLRDLRDRYELDVSVILNGERGSLVDVFREAGIPVHVASFDFTRSADLFSLPRKVAYLARLLWRERYDIVQTHLFHSMVIGRIAAWFADVPVRLSMIAGPFHLEAYTPRWIDRATCWMDTTIIPSCEFSRCLYRQMGVSDRRLAVIYYGPDERKFDPNSTQAHDLRAEYGWPSDTTLIGMVAYFYPKLGFNRWTPPALQGHSNKRQEDLIRAVPRVLAKQPKAKFLLVGSGWEDGGRAHMARMKQLVSELGLQDHVIFTDFRTDIPAVLRALDVAVQASISENLGGTIEALLMECPTVATRSGGMIDSVVDGITGILVNPRDPTDLADGILRLLEDRSRARTLAAEGRKRMLARFTLRSTVDDLACLYNRLWLGPRRGYRWYAVALRLAAGSVIVATIALRYVVFDVYLLRLWDAGIRPWNVVTRAFGRFRRGLARYSR